MYRKVTPRKFGVAKNLFAANASGRDVARFLGVSESYAWLIKKYDTLAEVRAYNTPKKREAVKTGNGKGEYLKIAISAVETALEALKSIEGENHV